MYKVMYRINETMSRHESAVIWDDNVGKMVPWLFTSSEEADELAEDMLANGADSVYIKHV